MSLIIYALAAVPVLVVAWVFYVAAMRLIPMVRDEMIPEWVKPFAFIAVLIALVLDVCANLIFSVIMLDVPRELLLTQKLKRLKLRGGWRARAAEIVCRDCLDAFDPDGDHC